jgi:hypothetical protein
MGGQSGFTPTSSGFTLLSDEPCTRHARPDLSGEGDALGFDAVAGELAATILSSRRSTPFSLGIEGGWGSGKSSLMRQLDQELSIHPAVTTVWFNAWSAEGASALEGLIKTALEKLDRNILRRVLRHRRVVGVLRFVGLVLTSRLGGGGLVDTTWERLSADAAARNPGQLPHHHAR